jgi:hypothetical protein
MNAQIKMFAGLVRGFIVAAFVAIALVPVAMSVTAATFA